MLARCPSRRPTSLDKAGGGLIISILSRDQIMPGLPPPASFHADDAAAPRTLAINLK